MVGIKSIQSNAAISAQLGGLITSISLKNTYKCLSSTKAAHGDQVAGQTSHRPSSSQPLIKPIFDPHLISLPQQHWSAHTQTQQYSHAHTSQARR